jgi:serine kinase of HPr protein (carbohydrate metabolism regulator)
MPSRDGEFAQGGQPRNLHATAVVIGERGIVIVGPSGAGKTTLALALLDHFAGMGQFARLISDDQVFLSAKGARVVCRAPASIAGLAEVHGIGPQPVAHERSAVIDLCLELVEGETERFQGEASLSVDGCSIPKIRVPARNVPGALQVVLSMVVRGGA